MANQKSTGPNQVRSRVNGEIAWSGNGHVNGQRVSRAREWRAAALFAKNFFTHPRMLGSIVPSSRFLIRRLLDPINWGTTRHVVEYGPGIGNITFEILDRLPPHGRVIAIDTNREFIGFLQRSIRDRRLTAVCASADDVQSVLSAQGIGQVDHVISGIPFSVMTPEDRRRILERTRGVLREGGSLRVYQFSPAVQPHLEEAFPVVEHEFEWLNILPAHVFYCRN